MTKTNYIPVTILTGFLGSGKTTLINHLLNHNQNEKIMIIENEFGPINIDGSLLKHDTNIDIIEMTNGCICCSVQGELITALHQLHQKRLAGEINFDRLIIETTGLADPAPILQTFFIDDVIRETIQLDAVITTVDCEHISTHLKNHRVAASQIGFADRIILTKTDRVQTADKLSVIARINAINNKAMIIEANHGQIAKTQWLDLHTFDLNDELTVSKGFFTVDISKQLVTKFTPFTSKLHSYHSYDDNIFSYLFEATELDLKKIGSFTEKLIEQYGNDMLRYKGVLAIKNQPQKLIIQGVHKVVGFDYGSAWDNTTPKESKFIVISRKLPFEELKQQFLATIAD